MSKRVPVVEVYKNSFPHGLMTYGCAKWAIHTAKKFSKNFKNVTGVDDRFASLDPKLP
jgi:hypothetical protein